MISKDEAKAKIKKAGYNVSVDGSLLTVIIEPGKSIKNTVKELKELFLKIDYNMSFSVKQSSLAGNTDTDNVDEIDEAEASDEIDSVDIGSSEKDVNEEKDFFDDEDDLEEVDEKLKLDNYDMDMILNESSMQFSLEDFGMM